jgi:hypothetical protein
VRSEKGKTRVSGSGAYRTIDDLERGFENRGKRKSVEDTSVLDLAVNGRETAGNWRRSYSVIVGAAVKC